MKMLALDAAVVPVTYRIRSSADGEVLGTQTHACLPSEIEAAATRVVKALENIGAENVVVEYWEA